jgi:hypothetical protein
VKIRWHEIGRAWAWDETSAYPYAAPYDVNLRTFHIVGLIALRDINWMATVRRVLECGPRIHEIRPAAGAVIDILRVTWREGGQTAKGPWHVLDHHPSVAQVT